MTKKKKTIFKNDPLLIIVIIFATFTTSTLFGFLISESLNDETSNKEEIVVKDENVEKFIKNYNFILENYYEEIKGEDLIKGAMSGMLDSLDDDFSSYLDVDENDNFQIHMNGSYEGLGISMRDTEDGILIISVFENSPASRAGLKAGDIISKIEDINFLDKTGDDVVNKVRKSDETEFTFVVLREGKEISLELEKGLVIIKSVNSEILKGNIGYISVDVFAANTYTQFKAELEKLEAENIKGLIIDLRNNAGGYLSGVGQMTSLFMDSDHVIYQTEEKGNTEVYKSTGKTTKEYPIVMLGNQNSASASEIMIAALVESYGASFVGMSTFGKGTVQELVDYNGEEAYKFTIKKWLTPDGNWINKIGFEPTHEVEIDMEYFKTLSQDDDNQLQKALELIKK